LVERENKKTKTMKFSDLFFLPLFTKKKTFSNKSNQQLRDLHRVQRGALLDLVPAHEEVEALFVLAGDVPAM
jgi:hypothetical protein